MTSLTPIPTPGAVALTAAAARLTLARRPCCPHCGQPRRGVPDSTTLPVPGMRLAACDCGEGR